MVTPEDGLSRCYGWLCVHVSTAEPVTTAWRGRGVGHSQRGSLAFELRTSTMAAAAITLGHDSTAGREAGLVTGNGRTALAWVHASP